ncbi:MAG: APC family permease [Hyphomicrobiaceae bacterium]|nr:APC family permease [Hyphomicrobiaceae bacterium]
MAGQADTGIDQPGLRRALSLRLVVLYGLGVTIGAGIYVLIGATSGRAGIHAPFSFLIAALVMAPTAASFAELTSRMPVSAGEAAYVRHAFGSRGLALMVGLLVVTAGVVSAAAVAIGAAGYIRVFMDVPPDILTALVIVVMGLAAAWGIVESVSVAAILTLIEIAGLLLIIGAGLTHDPALVMRVSEVVPLTTEPDVWGGIFAAGLLAFFAFIGFEDMVNIAEEANEPLKTLPRAIFLTLLISTLLYVLVVSVAVLSVPIEGLAKSTAPLGFVYEQVTGGSPLVISAVAIVATLNGIIVQMIMASRVLYGLSSQGDLPAIIGRVNRVTRTPLVATGLVVGIVLLLGLVFPIEGLAEMTSRVTLTVFCLVNLSLIRVKFRGEPVPKGGFQVRMWVPVTGLLASLALLAHDIVG